MAERAFTVLRCDERTIPADYPFAEQIAEYSPVLVLFPEDKVAGPPWKRRPADYHPRAVEVYLDNARPRSPALWVAPRGLFFLSMPINALADWLTRVFRRVTRPKLQEMLAANLDDGLHRVTLDSGVRPSQSAWRRYHHILETSGGAYPHRSYVHVVKAGENRIAIQYWFFYYFNDYWNRHQADFEVVTVFLRRVSRELEPTGCYFGAHRGGSYRLWQVGGVWRVYDQTHPIAFVGRGSHAFYAAPSLGGERIPTMLVPLGIPLILDIDAHISPMDVRRHVTDDVVVANQHEIEAAYADPNVPKYDVRVVPSHVADIHPGTNGETWEQFWWLRFKGMWGPGNWLPTPLPAQSGIHGPAQQDRWADPWGYLAKCEADIDWRQL